MMGTPSSAANPEGGSSINQRRGLVSPSPEQRLAGQVALITGGSSGIGAATARVFAAHGARVVIADVQPPVEEGLLEELGPGAEYVQCDVRNEDDVRRAWDRAHALEGRLDVVHSNAGVSGPFSAIEDLPMEEYDAMMAVNLRGMVLAVKHAARLMKPAGRGSIICTSSAAALMGGGAPLSYGISKTAVLGLVKAAAADLAKHGVRINAILPTGVPTPLLGGMMARMTKTPRSLEDGMKLAELSSDRAAFLPGRKSSVLDVANAALFLASDMSGYVSGLNLTVDGGMTTMLGHGSSGSSFNWNVNRNPIPKTE